MNKKLVLLIALVVALVSLSAVSAGFLDFLGLGSDDGSDVSVVEDGQYCTVDEVRSRNTPLEKALEETPSSTGSTYCRTAIQSTSNAISMRTEPTVERKG